MDGDEICKMNSSGIRKVFEVIPGNGGYLKENSVNSRFKMDKME